MNPRKATPSDYDALAKISWNFEAWDEGNRIIWLEGDEIVAYARFLDRDDSGLTFFEVAPAHRNRSIGGQIIRALQAERPDFYIAGDIDNAGCARFWHRLGFDCDGVELSNGQVWHAKG